MNIRPARARGPSRAARRNPLLGESERPFARELPGAERSDFDPAGTRRARARAVILGC
jgi:hypothetical protein